MPAYSALASEPHLDLRFSLRRAGGGSGAFTLQLDTRLPGAGVSAVFGASGSGKTTLLRCIAGLETPDGYIAFGDDVWLDGRQCVPAHRRRVGYVFQESGLLPHLGVRDNLAYAQRRAPGGNAANSFNETVELLDLGPLLEREPGALSGGERQRVSIAQAILNQPKLLLMDEPLAALDAARRAEILPYLDRLREQALPIVYVSHNLDEVARLADHLLVLRDGAAIDQGGVFDVMHTAPDLLHQGAETGVVVEGSIGARDAEWHLMRADLPGAQLWLKDTGDAPDTRVRMRILARDVSLATEPPGASTILNRVPVTIREIIDDHDPSSALLKLDAGGTILLARVTARSAHALDLQPGRSAWAQIKSVAVVR